MCFEDLGKPKTHVVVACFKCKNMPKPMVSGAPSGCLSRNQLTFTIDDHGLLVFAHVSILSVIPLYGSVDRGFHNKS